MKQKSLKKKAEGILTFVDDVLLCLICIVFFAIFAALMGKLVNYSPWSLLIIDIIFIFVAYKFINEFYYSEHIKTRKKKKIWDYFFLVLTFLAVIISTGVSLEHFWAIINIPGLILLFFFSLVLFISNAVKKNLI